MQFKVPSELSTVTSNPNITLFVTPNHEIKLKTVFDKNIELNFECITLNNTDVRKKYDY